MGKDLITTPFSNDVVQLVIPEGNTITELLGAAEIPIAIWDAVTVTVNGIKINQTHWDTIHFQPQDVISIFVTPMGSGGKDVLRLVAVLAIAIAAPYGAGYLGVAHGIGTSVAGQAILVAGITLVGTMAVNALIPPPKPSEIRQSAQASSYFITGQSNRARIGEIVPIVYGVHRMVANLATTVEVINAGNQSVFAACYDFGLGGVTLSDIKAGDTDISVFDATIRQHKRKPDWYPDPADGLQPIILQLVDFPTKYVDINVGLNDAGESGEATTAKDSSSAVVELTFPQGLVNFSQDGDEKFHSVSFKASFRATGTTPWLGLPLTSHPLAATSKPDGDKTYLYVRWGEGDPSDLSPGTTPVGGTTKPTVSIRSVVNSITANDVPPARTTLVDDGVLAIVTIEFNTPAFLTTADTFKVYESTPVQQIDSLDGKIDDTYDPGNGWVEAVAGSGIWVVQDAGVANTKYQFRMWFRVGYPQGHYYIRIDPKLLATSENTRFENTQPLVTTTWLVDMSVSVQPTFSPPLEIYDLTPGAENYCEVIESRLAGIASTFTNHGTNFLVLKDGKEHEVSLNDIQMFKGTFKEYFGGEWISGNRLFRRARYALLTAGVIIEFPDGGGNDPIKPGDPIVRPTPLAAGVPLSERYFPYEPLVGEDQSATSFTVFGRKATPGIISIVIRFPGMAQYDIKVERITATPTDTNNIRVIDGCSWTKLNSRGASVSYRSEFKNIPQLPDARVDPRATLNLRKQHTLLELEYKANENIQGNVQQINALAHGEIRDFLLDVDDTVLWQPLVDVFNNPALVVLDILTGYSIQNHKDVPKDYLFDGGWIKDSQIDFPSFLALKDTCNEQVKYETYDGQLVEDQPERARYACDLLLASDAPIIETCQSLLSMCRSQLILNQAGKFAIMQDKEQTIPRQMFTPQNSWGFNGSRSFVSQPHALNVKFTSPELGYQEGTITVYRPPYTEQDATIYEDIFTFGVTHWDQAALYGIYMLAQGLIRSETFTLFCDIESLVVQRGDMVHINHDVPLLSGQSCIVKLDSTGTLVTVDQLLNTYGEPAFSLRQPDGVIVHGQISNIVNDTFTAVLPVTVKQGDIIVVGQEIEHVVGEGKSVTVPYLISEIRPAAELTAELKLVKYDPDVYNANWATFPRWNAGMGDWGSQRTSLFIDSVGGRSDIKYVDRQPISVTNIEWTVAPIEKVDTVAAFIITFAKGDREPTLLIQVDGDVRNWSHEYSTFDPDFGAGHYAVTPVSTLGFQGQSLSFYIGNTVDLTAPAPVQGFSSAFTIDNATTLSWTANTEGDLNKYLIYLSVDEIIDNELTTADYIASVPYDAVEWTTLFSIDFWYYIVAVDTSGNESTPSRTHAAFGTPGAIQNFTVNFNGTQSTLTWDLLVGEDIDSYTLQYNPNDAVQQPGDDPDTVVLGSVNGLTSSFPIDPLLGAYFIHATNKFGVDSAFARALASTDATFRDGLFWDGANWIPDRRTRFVQGGYVENTDYYRGDEVANGSQIAECIVPRGASTQESPFIVPIGDTILVHTNVLTASQQFAKSIIIGNRFTQGESGYIMGYEIDVVVGNSYTVTFITDPEGSPIYNELDDFIATSSGLLTRQLPASIVLAGSVYDLVVNIREPDPTPTVYTYNWNYTTPQNFITPAAGECVHPNASTDVIRFNKIDSDGIDDAVKPVGEKLTDLEVGDIIELGSVRWAIQGITDFTTYMSFVVAPSTQSTPDGVQAFSFETVTATPITFGLDTDWWLTVSFTGKGLLIVDGKWSDIVPDNTYYAIQPFYQKAHIPEDWKVKVLTSGAVGGQGAGFVPNLFAGAGTSGYVPDPGTELGKVLGDDGAWVDVLKNPVPYIDFQDNAGVAYFEGRLFYDDVEHALSYYNDSSDVTVNMGQELVAKVRNNSGATILNGSVVRLTGAIGNRPTIGLCDPSLPSTARAVGVMTHDLGNNSDGYVTLIGVVRGIDTSGFNEGDRLYPSATTPGELTPVQAPFAELVAVVTVVNPSNGWIYVKTRSLDLTDYWQIYDVDITAKWNQRIRMETPPNSVTLPPPDQNITEVLSDITIWNNSRLSDQYVTIIPSPGTYFTFDGVDKAPDETLTLSPGEIGRFSTRVTGISYGFAIDAASGFDGAGTFGFVRDPVAESGRFLSDDGTWISPAIIPAGGIRTEMIFDTLTANTPAAGHARMNSVDPALANALYISETNLLNNNIALFLLNLKHGDFIGYVDNTGGGGTYYWTVDAAGSITAGVFTVTVTTYKVDGAIPDQTTMNLNLIGNPENRLPDGGAENWVLAKASGVDFHTEWQNLDGKYPLDNVPQNGWTFGRFWDGGTFEWNTGDAAGVVAFKADNGFGIGTLTPAAGVKLHVEGKAYADALGIGIADSTRALHVRSVGQISTVFETQSTVAQYLSLLSPTVTNVTSHGLKLYGDDDRMAFRVNNVDVLTGTTKSRIGIGIPDPLYMLDVNGDVNIPTGSLYRINGSQHPHVYADISDPPTIPDNGDYVDLLTDQTVAGIKTWTLNALFQAKIGIGTNNPSKSLVVQSGAFSMEFAPEDNGRIICYDRVGSERFQPLYVDCDQFYVRTGGASTVAERFRINGDGLVGVGLVPVAAGNQAQNLQVAGGINIGNGENYYIDGIPISTFVDAPADGNIYARRDNAWASVGAGTGTVSDLTSAPTVTTVVIQNTGGNNATILDATSARAGVMTTDQVDKLAAIAVGANLYVHPTFTPRTADADTTPMTGAEIISDLDFHVTSDSEGHVTGAAASVSKRNLTPADIGAAEAGDLVPITGNTEVLTVSGVTASGTIIRTTVGNLVMLTGRLSWSTAGSGTSSVYITGLTYPCGFSTGGMLGVKNVRNTSSDAAGIGYILEAGATSLLLNAPNAQGISGPVQYNHLDANGHINIDISYYTNVTPTGTKAHEGV